MEGTQVFLQTKESVGNPFIGHLTASFKWKMVG
jgi:hypothetical protein